MPNYKLIIEYDGSKFWGWQVQPKVRTVQGELEDALFVFLKEKTRLACAGRTDRGVHALAQVANFRCERRLDRCAVEKPSLVEVGPDRLHPEDGDELLGDPAQDEGEEEDQPHGDPHQLAEDGHPQDQAPQPMCERHPLLLLPYKGLIQPLRGSGPSGGGKGRWRKGGLGSMTRVGGVATALIREMRPKQWTKNLLLYAGALFSRRLLDPQAFGRATLAFLLFCALSSAVYILNDWVDLEQDRRHPRKRHRPLASGALPLPVAVAALVLLLLIGVGGSFLWLGTPFGLLALLYLAVMVAYSFWLKHIVILDVFTIAAGFVLRAFAGAVAIPVVISPWLFICTLLLALFLGLGKRRHELLLLEEAAGEHRPILLEYTPQLLDEMMGVVTASVVIAYSLYTFSAENLPKNHAMMFTIPFVLYGIFRYLYLVHRRNEGGSPEELLLGDWPLLLDVVLWGLTSMAILYLWG